MLTDACRDDFPVLSAKRGQPPAYLDSAATTLRPKVVVDAMRWYLENSTAAIHRGVHHRSIAVTDRFEATRERLAGWLGADTDEIIFTSGTTAAIHLVRHGLRSLKRVAVTAMEHHSNLVPWLDMGIGKGCTVIPVDVQGQIDMTALQQTLQQGVDLLAVTHISNVLGCVTPIESLIALAHEHDTKVLVDAAQSASHCAIDVRQWEADFLVCSSHKMLGPSGAGALYASREMHERLQPVVLGGQMVDQVSLTGWTTQSPPHCYEAGSPPAESVIGWGAALEYLEEFGQEAINKRLEYLTTGLLERLSDISGVRMLGPLAGPRGPLVSFLIDGLESHAVAKMLSQRDDVVVRSGFHCAQPLHQHLGIGPTVRASLQIYNTEDDLDRLSRTLQAIAKLRVM